MSPHSLENQANELKVVCFSRLPNTELNHLITMPHHMVIISAFRANKHLAYEAIQKAGADTPEFSVKAIELGKNPFSNQEVVIVNNQPALYYLHLAVLRELEDRGIRHPGSEIISDFRPEFVLSGREPKVKVGTTEFNIDNLALITQRHWAGPPRNEMVGFTFLRVSPDYPKPQQAG